MHKISELPNQPIQIEVYQWNGETKNVLSRFFPGKPVEMDFYSIIQTQEKVTFDATMLTEQEKNLAQSRWQGELLSIIAVPYGLVYRALNSGQGKLYVIIDNQTYSTSQMFDYFKGSMSDPVAVGVYTGAPAVLNLLSTEVENRSGESTS